MMTWYKRVTWHKASQAQGTDRLERTMRWFMKRRKNRRKSVWLVGWERRVKIVGHGSFLIELTLWGWNGFLPNLGEKIGKMSRFDEKLSICTFPLNLHCFFLSFLFFWKKNLSSSTFLFLHAIKFFLSNVNLYNLHFLYSHFFSQPNKRVFYPFTFHPQPNTTREN